MDRDAGTGEGSSPAEASYAVVADRDGFHVTVGPLDVGEALLFVDAQVHPGLGWRHRFVRLHPPAEAADILAIGSRSGIPLEPDPDGASAQLLLGQLRRAVREDPANGGLDDPAVQLLITHLDPHRPMRLYQADDEDCLLNECDHPRTPAGLCSELAPADLICVRCTPIFVPGGDWPSSPLPQCRVAWPCGVLLAAAAHYGIAAPAVDRV